jgi:hypothetical protein
MNEKNGILEYASDINPFGFDAKSDETIKFIDESETKAAQSEQKKGNTWSTDLQQLTWVTDSSNGSTLPFRFRNLRNEGTLADDSVTIYSLWKKRFIQKHKPTSRSFSREVLLSVFPHFVIVFLVFAYMTVGAVILRHMDQKLAALPFCEVLFFTYTTLTTIGYGHVVPTCAYSKIFTICYTVFGIPLVFLTFANMGQFLAEFYWLLFTWITRRKEVITDALPLYVTAFLLLTHSVIGGVIFHFWIDEMPFVAAIYFRHCA